MYISKFIVEQDYDGKKLLFSTLTTALVKIEKDIYKRIFIDGDFVTDAKLIDSLVRMGFLHHDNFDEMKALEDIRRSAYEINKTPVYYIITPTLACNARCYYCFENGAIHHTTMSEETANAVADHIISNYKNGKRIVIQWFGGEPLLATNIIDLITSRLNSAEIDYLSKIITNGYLISDDILKNAVVKWKLKTIQITLDGLEEDYNRIKNYVYKDCGSPFKKVISNIKKTLAYSDLNVRLRINVDFNNLQKSKDIISYLKTEFGSYPNCTTYFAPINAPEIEMPSITDKFENKSKHPLLSMLDFEEGYAGLGQSRLYLKENPNDWEKLLLKYYLYPVPVACFGACESSHSIDSQGNIYVCHRFFGKGEEYASGNVKTGLIENEVAKHYRDYHVHEKCLNCNLLPICQGGCKYNREVYGENQGCVPSKGVVKELIVRALEEMENINKHKEDKTLEENEERLEDGFQQNDVSQTSDVCLDETTQEMGSGVEPEAYGQFDSSTQTMVDNKSGEDEAESEQEGSCQQEESTLQPTEEKHSVESENKNNEELLTSMDDVKNSIEKISERIDGISNSEQNFLSEIQGIKKLYQNYFADRLKTMENELEKYRKQDDGSIFDEILGAIARIYVNFEYLTDVAQDPKLKKNIKYMFLSIEDLLSEYGVQKQKSCEGEKRRAKYCEIRERELTDEPMKHDTVKNSHHSGFFKNNRIIIAEPVDIYFYEKSMVQVDTEEKQTCEPAEDSVSNK